MLPNKLAKRCEKDETCVHKARVRLSGSNYPLPGNKTHSKLNSKLGSPAYIIIRPNLYLETAGTTGSRSR